MVGGVSHTRPRWIRGRRTGNATNCRCDSAAYVGKDNTGMRKTRHERSTRGFAP